MKNKETGEFELLVGNGQIISGFFILALLLAVFFAMGFIVARAKYQQEPATAASISSTPASETRVPAAAPETPPVAPPADSTKPPDDAHAPTATQTPAETKAEKAEPAPAEAVPAETPQGTYWQISATANLEAAHALQQTIKDMGLPVTLSQGPNKLTRVLVGPYTDVSTMAHVKTQLENAGLQPVKHQQ
jgi:cell division septation protein DedD